MNISELSRSWSKGMIGNIITIPYVSNITLDLAQSNFFKINLDGQLLLNNPINSFPGQSGLIITKQNNIGNNIITYGSMWKWEKGKIDSPIITSNSLNILSFFIYETNLIFCSWIKDIK